MKKQTSFSEAEYAGKKRVTKRERFLAEMEKVVPWTRLVAAVEPHYPKGERGRPPIGLQRMLRIYFLQQWYGLSDEGLEDALYDSMAMRAFAGIDLAVENVPDATTLLKFRRLLVEHDLTGKLFDEIGIMLCERGLMMREGTIVDATIIEAPPSTKNAKKSRDPEMHQTKKGNEWHFGMKAHIGVDASSGLVHSVVGTAANESDVSQAHALLHGHEEDAFGDAGYTGVEKRDEMQGKGAKWHVALKAQQDQGDARWRHQGLAKSRRRGPRLRFGLGSNIRSMSSRICLVIARFVTRAWPRTRRNCSACSVSPIWCSPGDSCWPALKAFRPERAKRARHHAKTAENVLNRHFLPAMRKP
ncbi:transposase TIS1021 (plasmid) [Ralstonia solanacearum]|nr:transposase TIS1021 [Ralstonia solanacearum]